MDVGGIGAGGAVAWALAVVAPWHVHWCIGGVGGGGMGFGPTYARWQLFPEELILRWDALRVAMAHRIESRVPLGFTLIGRLTLVRPEIGEESNNCRTRTAASPLFILSWSDFWRFPTGRRGMEEAAMDTQFTTGQT